MKRGVLACYYALECERQHCPSSLPSPLLASASGYATANVACSLVSACTTSPLPKPLAGIRKRIHHGKRGVLTCYYALGCERLHCPSPLLKLIALAHCRHPQADTLRLRTDLFSQILVNDSFDGLLMREPFSWRKLACLQMFNEFRLVMLVEDPTSPGLTHSN